MVLSTQPAEGAVLGRILRAYNPGLEIVVVSDKGALGQLAREDLAHTRLLSFCSPLIIPHQVLAALPGPSYNFHPGPPDRPGRFPSVFAIYERSERFGVTVHQMVERVDAGPIVAAEWFSVPSGADVVTLEEMALECLIAVFRRLAPFLALNGNPLPRIFVPWTGRTRTKAECDAICTISADLDDAERELRRRACGSLLRG